MGNGKPAANSLTLHSIKVASLGITFDSLSSLKISFSSGMLLKDGLEITSTVTKYLSTYWSDKGVRCNALSPGGVYNGQDDKFINKLSELIPLGRMANKDEYHSAVQFLCSDASSYMNGQNVVMDGGRSTW